MEEPQRDYSPLTSEGIMAGATADHRGRLRRSARGHRGDGLRRNRHADASRPHKATGSEQAIPDQPTEKTTKTTEKPRQDELSWLPQSNGSTVVSPHDRSRSSGGSGTWWPPAASSSSESSSGTLRACSASSGSNISDMGTLYYCPSRADRVLQATLARSHRRRGSSARIHRLKEPQRHRWAPSQRPRPGLRPRATVGISVAPPATR